MSDGAPHATSTHSIARRTLPRASSSVLPCSVVTVRARSSNCCSRSALKRCSTWARALTGLHATAGSSVRPIPTRRQLYGGRQQNGLCLARPPFFPRRPRRLARAAAQAIELFLFGRKRLEQIEENVGELDSRREQEPIVAVAHALGETRAVVEGAHGHSRPEQVGDLHRNIQARRRPVQAQAEIRSADHARIIFRLEPSR